MSDQVIQVSLKQIEPFRDRGRDSEKFDMLVASIKQHGIIEPVVVAPNDRGAKRKYRLIAGHGRLRAAKRAGLQRVPAVLRERFCLTDFIVENWRKDLAPYEQAVLVQHDLQAGISRQEVAKKFAIHTTLVDQYARVMTTLNEDLKGLVKRKVLPMSQALKVARSGAPQGAQVALYQSIQRAEREGVSPAQVKTAISDVLGAIKVEGGSTLDSLEKLQRVKREVKEEHQDAQSALNVIRSHYLRSYVELRKILKQPSVRSLFDAAGIDYKPVMEAE